MSYNSSGKIKILKYRGTVSSWIIKHWFILNLFYIVFYALYIVFKILHGKKSFFYDYSETTAPFSVFWFIINLIGYAIIAFALISGIKFKIWQYVSLLFIGFIVITVSLLKNDDPELKWAGSDVAIGNYLSAEDGVKYGVRDLIDNWNDRANPYDRRDFNLDNKDSIRQFIEKHNLSWIAFDKWKNVLDTSRYDLLTNNRPYMHPPFAPVVMALWLKILPFDKWSMEILMMVFTLLSVLLVILYSYKKDIGNFKSIIILSILTSPVLFRFHSPSTDQMSMLLFTIPILVFLLYPSGKFWTAVMFGIIYGLCFYTKFIMMIFIFVMLISLLVYIKKLSFKFLLGFILGLLITVIIFTSLGYYFWLTIISGQILANNNNINGNINIIDLFTKLLYFGPSFLLLFIYLMLNTDKLDKSAYPFFIPVIISIFLTMAAAPAVWNRYLIHFMPSVLLFVISMDKIMDLKKRDLIISLIANITFFHLNNYF